MDFLSNYFPVMLKDGVSRHPDFFVLNFACRIAAPMGSDRIDGTDSNNTVVSLEMACHYSCRTLSDGMGSSLLLFRS